MLILGRVICVSSQFLGDFVGVPNCETQTYHSYLFDLALALRSRSIFYPQGMAPLLKSDHWGSQIANILHPESNINLQYKSDQLPNKCTYHISMLYIHAYSKIYLSRIYVDYMYQKYIIPAVIFIYIYVSVIVRMKPDCQNKAKTIRGLHRLDPLSVSCRHCNAKVQGPDSTAFGQRLGRIHWSKKVCVSLYKYMLIYVFCHESPCVYNIMCSIQLDISTINS